MSVVTNQYLILGVKLPYDKAVPYETFEDFIDNGYKPDIIHKNGLACIFDGMNGKYVMLGRIIEKSPLNHPLDGVFCLEPVDKERAEFITSLINLSFPHLTVDVSEIKQWFVTHYH
jgi:hypothetical protein